MRRILIIVALLMGSVAAYAQKTVTGRVTDEADAPLMNAVVMIPGTSVGALTDEEGRYSIEVPEEHYFLELDF